MKKIKQKKTPVVYKTDKIANLHGHEVIRTLVRHCELNPIELIWAQVKGFVAKNNTTLRLKDVKVIVKAICLTCTSINENDTVKLEYFDKLPTN
jgi:hypothetical protein